MKTTKTLMIDGVTSKMLKDNLTKKDKLEVCAEKNCGYAYVSAIINQERFNKDIADELIKRAKKKIKSKSK